MSAERERVEALLEKAVAVRPSGAVDPLCDPADLSIGKFLDFAPKPRRWILDDLLPLGIVGLLAAGGGTGKSFLTLQLGISIATGRPFFGIPVGEPGSVLLLCAEDDRDEIHRRFWRIVQALRDFDQFSDADEKALRSRLFIASRVGEDNLLTNLLDGSIVRTKFGERIAATAEQIPDLKLIVLDPVSRFRGGDENSNDHATRFVEAVEALRTATGATILMPHHVSKDGLRAGADGLNIESLRGASALADAVRWAAAMATLRKDAAEGYGIEPEEASRYVRLDLVKSSYSPPWGGMWLERGFGGVLAPANVKPAKQSRAEQKADDRAAEVMQALTGLIRQHQERGEPLTMRKLRDYGGKSGMFKVGEKTLVSIAQGAIAKGQIKAHETGDKRGTVELRTW